MNGPQKNIVNWLLGGGFVIILAAALKIGGFWEGTGAMAQDIQENSEAIATQNDTINEHETEIEVLKVEFVNLAKDVKANTAVQTTTNVLLLELIQEQKKGNN